MNRREEFERCWPWLHASMKLYGETHTMEQLWMLIDRRKVFFWPDTESAMVGEIMYHPSGLRSGHLWLAGGDADQIMSHVPWLEEVARRNACHRALVTGRDGWLRANDRLLEKRGWRKLSTRIVKEF